MKSIIKPLRDVGFLTLALTFALTVNYAYGQWTNPGQAPTGGNVEVPVNVSPNPQIKSGILGVSTLNSNVTAASIEMRSPVYCDENGLNCISTADVGTSSSSTITATTNVLKIYEVPVTDLTLNDQMSSRKFNSILNSSTDVTFYSANKDTADFLCREQYRMHEGYWTQTGFPVTDGWAGYTNLAIAAYDPTALNSVRYMCTDGTDCNNNQYSFGRRLTCVEYEDAKPPVICGRGMDVTSDSCKRVNQVAPKQNYEPLRSALLSTNP